LGAVAPDVPFVVPFVVSFTMVVGFVSLKDVRRKEMKGGLTVYCERGDLYWELDWLVAAYGPHCAYVPTRWATGKRRGFFGPPLIICLDRG
jgi:hypothetical protein